LIREPSSTAIRFPLAAPRIWVDRTYLLAALRAHTRISGLTRVLLHGLPGIGKTALAATWLASLDALPGSLPLIATLQAKSSPAVTAHEVLAEWLRTLGVAPELVPPSLAQRSAAFRQHTQNTPIVALIDNVTSVADVRALLPGGDCSIVVATSRLRLGELIVDGFELYPLAELPADDATALLTAYQPQVPPPDAQPGWRDLATHCRGHPLMLCLAAAFLAMRRHTAPADLLTLLARRSADTLTVGDRSMGDLLTVVYDDLTPLAQRLYRLLPDHPGPDFTVAVLAAALDEQHNPVEDAMHELFRAHLACDTGAGRYALGHNVRRHAERRRLEVDGAALRDEQLHRLITWYVDGAAGAADTIKTSAHRYTRIFSDHRADNRRHSSAADAQEWFDRERLNIMAALYTAAELGLDDLLAEAAEAVWDPLRRSYRFDDIAASQIRASRAAQTVSTAFAAAVAARAAFALTSLGATHDALATAEEAVQLAQGADDSWAVAMTLSTRARALMAAGRIQEAITDLGDALVLDRQRGDQRSIALRLRRLGEAQLTLGNPCCAVPLLHTSVEEMETAGDRAGHARSLTYLAKGCLAAGDPEGAQDAAYRAIGYFEQTGAIRHLVEARLVVARAFQQYGDFQTADSVCGDLLLVLADESGAPAEACRTEIKTLREQLG
jgi:tetratricopeptide (TPR) repeat protein